MVIFDHHLVKVNMNRQYLVSFPPLSL